MKTQLTMKKLLVLVAGIIAFQSINAATITWTGNHSNNWNHVLNWSPAIVPNNNDEVVIPSTWLTEIVVDGANASCKKLTYNGIGFQLQIGYGWELILAGDLNISGNSKIYGTGGIEVVGNYDCHFNHSDSTIIELNHINIKSNANAYLNNKLFMPTGSVNVYSGVFITNGYPVMANSMSVVNGSSNRTLNIENSEITVNIFSLGLIQNGGFNSANSIVTIQLLAYADEDAVFNIVNALNKTTIAIAGDNTDLFIAKLNASKDISIVGNKDNFNQSFSIKEFNILHAPAIVRLTPTPQVSHYDFFAINTPMGCTGEILFTDGAEVSYNQVVFNALNPIYLSKASLANIRLNSGSLTVYQGADLGNNTNISFMQTNPMTFYWINGAGNWSDGNHWSYTSGGPSSGCIPGLSDHAILNLASGFSTGDTVHVNDHAFCNDLIVDPAISAKPVLAQNGSNTFTLNIAGSLDLRGLEDYRLEYAVYLWSRSNETIHLGSFKLLNDIHMMNRGSWELLSDLNCMDGQKAIFQLIGTFKTNGHEVHVSNLMSRGVKNLASKRGLDLSTSTLRMGHPNLSNGGVYIYSDSLTLQAGTSTFLFEHLLNLPHEFKIDGTKHLDFYNLRFMNQTTQPLIIFNTKTQFNKVTMEGNGKFVNGSNMPSATMSGMDTLVITGNFRYEFEQGKMFDISKKLIHQHGPCNELSFISSTSLANHSSIHSSGSVALDFSNVWIENIQASGNNVPFNVINGVDGGNNTNFNFTSPNLPRVFYWNGEGNTTYWSEGVNWNIGVYPHAGNNNDEFLYNTNGCIPGFNDSVVFTNISFPVSDTVYINENANFNGMAWLPGSGLNRFLAGNNQFEMNNYGGLLFDNNLDATFDGNLLFRSPGHRSLTFNHVVYRGSIAFYNLGKYTLLDEMNCAGYKVELLAGSFSSLGNSIAVNHLSIRHDYAPMYHNNIVNFGNSKLDIAGSFTNYLLNDVSTLMADSSSIHFSGMSSIMYIFGNLTQINYGRLYYSYPNGLAGLHSEYYSGTGLPHFRHIEFEPSGFIIGNNSIDTLILAEGKVYSLGSNHTQTINDLLYSKGSPCYRTTIISTVPGTRAYIKNPSCHLLVEHARLSDIEGILGTCSATNYLVGVGGEDLGNNANWYFIPGDPINGLGPDTILTCHTLPYEQTSTGFGRYETITWSNGTTNPSVMINGVDTVTATVVYSPVCIVDDERIFGFESQMDQNGTAIDVTCYGLNDGSITVELIDVDTNFVQTWIYPNGEQRTMDITIDQLSPGHYTSIVAIPGFESLCSDTAEFDIHEPGLLMLTLDTVIPGKCGVAEGIIGITAWGGTGELSYDWSDQSTSEDRYDAFNGWNQVVVTDFNGCKDSIAAELACIDHINVPELLTPNNDGLSDNWEIIDLYRLYPDNDVKVYNRWGGLVYNKHGYNDEFRGIPNTKDTFSVGHLPSGTYFYTIELGENNKVLTGYIELVY